MRRFLAVYHNRIGLALLAVLFMAQVVSAQGPGVYVPGIGQIPQWAVYVGLFAICPKDLNEAIRLRLGLAEIEDNS